MSQLVRDSGVYLPSEKAIEEYLNMKGANLPVYNGIEHLGYLRMIEGSAYYKTSYWEKGSVFYDGILYKDVYLKFDMITDEVIIRQPTNLLAIILFSPRVNYFYFLDNFFIYIPDTGHLSIPVGFYEQLTKGKISLLAKRKEIIEEKITTELTRRFVRRDEFYILKENNYYVIKNEKDVLNLLGEKKKRIKQYLKNNKVKFHRNREKALVKIAEQYNLVTD